MDNLKHKLYTAYISTTDIVEHRHAFDILMAVPFALLSFKQDIDTQSLMELIVTVESAFTRATGLGLLDVTKDAYEMAEEPWKTCFTEAVALYVALIDYAALEYDDMVIPKDAVHELANKVLETILEEVTKHGLDRTE